MKENQPTDIRNIVLLGHNGVGKTSVGEGILFAAGVTKRLGKVDDGTSILDHAADEVERKITINMGYAGLVWKTFKVNLLDTPGYADFYGDVLAALRVVDAAALVVRGDARVEVGTEKVWGFATRRQMPALLVVNRMDREHADFSAVLEAVGKGLGFRAVPAFLPLGQGESFEGLIDVLGRTAYRYRNDGSGQFAKEAVPAGEGERLEAAHASLVEAAVEADDALLERYLEGGTLSDEEVNGALVEAVRCRKVVPAIPVSAGRNIGFTFLLDMITRLVPSPESAGEVAVTLPGDGKTKTRPANAQAPLASLVFKTLSAPQLGDLSLIRVYSGVLQPGSEVLNSGTETAVKMGQIFRLVGKERFELTELRAGDIGAAVKLKDTHTGNTLCDRSEPVIIAGVEFPRPHISVAIEPKSKGDEDKIGTGLGRLQEEDQTFQVVVDPEMRQTIISGLGELHLEVAVDRLRRRFGVEVEMVRPRIPYRETIRGKAAVQGKYKKQTGGRGQYGDVWLRLEPRGRGEGFTFVDDIVGGAIPGKYVPAVEKGVRECMAEGVVAGCPVVDISAAVYDGSYHDVDSSDMAFKIAASMAFKKAFMEANPILLEPIYEIVVTVPEENLGDVMGDLSGRRGKILGVESEGAFQVVKALVPQAELWKYSTQLRSLTQGRGMHEGRLSHYEEMPREITEKVIAEAAQAKKEK